MASWRVNRLETALREGEIDAQQVTVALSRQAHVDGSMWSSGTRLAFLTDSVNIAAKADLTAAKQTNKPTRVTIGLHQAAELKFGAPMQVQGTTVRAFELSVPNLTPPLAGD